MWAHALGLWVAMTLLAVGFGEDRFGTWTVYAPAKQLVCDLGGWLLLLAFGLRALRHGGLPPVASFPLPSKLLAAFLVWASVGRWWAWVPALADYELRRWLLIGLVLALALRDLSERSFRSVVVGWWISAAALATAVAGLQWAGWVPRLVAINPQAGVWFPSVMGYKNPMALALVGQWFLLAGFAARRRGFWRWLSIGLCLAESVYLVTLLSRTAWAAWAVGCLTVLGRNLVDMGRRPGLAGLRSQGPGIALVVTCAGLVLALASAMQPRLWQRLDEAIQVSSSEGLAATDRMAFWRNSLEMARAEPFGVGLGNWQAAYPVFRVHRPAAGFGLERQVRRAHSDHLQLLAETGWIGASLWVAAWLSLLWCSCTRGDPWLAGQTVVWALILATDYVVVQPHHLLAMLVLWALVVSAASRTLGGALPSRPATDQVVAGGAGRARDAACEDGSDHVPGTVSQGSQSGFDTLRFALACLLVLAVVTGALRATRGFQEAVAVSRLSVATEAIRGTDDLRWQRELEAVLAQPWGWQLESPTVHQARVQMASLAAAAGRPRLSASWAWRTFETAPYDLQAIRWMAFALRGFDEESADEWQELASRIEAGGLLGRLRRPRRLGPPGLP